jgi:hypothetical protein
MTIETRLTPLLREELDRIVEPMPREALRRTSRRPGRQLALDEAHGRRPGHRSAATNAASPCARPRRSSGPLTDR